MSLEAVKIGTMIRAGSYREDADWAASAGFESVEIFSKSSFLEGLDLTDFPIPVSSVGLYGDIVQDSSFASEFKALIQFAGANGVPVVSAFTGAFRDESILDQCEKVASLWMPLAKLATEIGVKIAFEQCSQGGTWDSPKRNLVHSLRGWDLFSTYFQDAPVFLEWEPGHQILQFANPLLQLDRILPQVAHIHGKDAMVNQELVDLWGIDSGLRVTHFRLPSRGQTDWTAILKALDRANWVGSIDVEGFHDPAFSGEMEREGQVMAMQHLKQCRAEARG